MSQVVAVAGGFGFLGANVSKVLQEHGFETVPFSRRSGVDIRDWQSISSFMKKVKPEIVVNCAADVGGIAYNSVNPVGVYENNLLIGFNLIKASFESGIKKFVNIIPNCTYPGVAEIYTERGWWDGPMHDTVVTYGMPRKALWVHAWALKVKHGFNSIHLVLPNLYGPNDHFDPIRSHALGAIIRKVVDAKVNNVPTVEIWGSGEPIREWLYVEDASEGIVRATQVYNDIEIMNIGTGIGFSIKEIANMVKLAADWGGEFVFDRSRPDGAPKKILDVSRMKEVLNWWPKTNIEQGIRKTVEWYLTQRGRI
jgi:GDP-L-fucose synthase